MRFPAVRPLCILALAFSLPLSFSASTAEPPPPAAPTAPASEDPEAPTGELDESLDEMEEVIVYGTNGQLVAGLQAESELDTQGIAAYGANTVGELLNQVAPDVDNSEQGPVILINGKPANGMRSVNDLPPEAIAKLQVLPPQAAGAIGESPTRRVINVVLQPQFRQGTANVTARAATAGQGTGTNANYSMLRLVGNNIRNLSIYASQSDPMRESQRGIVTQPTVVPYDLTGNVLSWPVTGGEIDPALSALAGVPVIVAGVPAGIGSPALADFALSPNIANVSNMGRYRTLVADQYSYGMNGNFSRQLPRNIQLNLNGNLDRNESRSLTGATSTLLHVPASSPFSPFDRDVNIARYLGDPLRQKRESTNANVSANLSMQLGRWRMMSDNNFTLNQSTTRSERRVDTAALQAAINAGTLNPFEALPTDLLDEVLSDHAKARLFSASARVQLAGTLFTMPAGKANGNLSVQWQESNQRSRTVGTNNVNSTRKRQDQVAYFSMQLPLAGSPQSQGFGMGGELNSAARKVTATGTLFTYGYGLNWRNGNRINMRVGFNREKQAPSPGSLTDPVVTIDDYRSYDFIRQETVLVRYITGGNPDLLVENRDIINVSGQVRPFTKIDFTLNAQYTRTMYHDPVSSTLPAPSQEVQAAFPDRFRRDADGRLFEIDARPVNFVRTRNEQLRWGGNFRRAFGVPKTAAPSAQMPMGQVISTGTGTVFLSGGDGSDSLSGAGWRLNANFTHSWQVAYKRLMREGLPVVDLLSGGAGTGGGQSRHTVQSTVGLAYNGTGMQLNSNWKSGTFITAGTTSAPNRIEFDSLLRFDLQAFTNLANFFPTNAFLKGTRISMNVDNLLDAKQRVRDQNGVTPLRYQPYLINALGRVVSLSFRKAL